MFRHLYNANEIYPQTAQFCEIDVNPPAFPDKSVFN